MLNNNQNNSHAKIKSKNQYKKLAIKLKPIDYEFIDDLARSRHMTKSSLIIKALLYIAYYGIDLSEDVPNTETLKAMIEVEEMSTTPSNHKSYASVEELLDALNADIDESED